MKRVRRGEATRRRQAPMLPASIGFSFGARYRHQTKMVTIIHRDPGNHWLRGLATNGTCRCGAGRREGLHPLPL